MLLFLELWIRQLATFSLTLPKMNSSLTFCAGLFSRTGEMLTLTSYFLVKATMLSYFMLLATTLFIPWISSFTNILYELRSCLYEKNHPTPLRRLTWVRSQHNGVFYFVKTNRLYENGFSPPRWDLTSTQVRSHLGGMIFLHVNSLYRTAEPRQDFIFGLASVYFYNYFMKKCNSSYKISGVNVIYKSEIEIKM